jgi:DinB family protein
MNADNHATRARSTLAYTRTMNLRLDEIVEVLGRTPSTLRALLAPLADPWLRCDEGPGTFSPRDVLGHLIFGEETDWIPRARIILEHGESRPFDPFDRFGFKERSVGLTVAELLDRFEALRQRNLAELESLRLDRADLERKGRHPELGSVTLGQLLATWVAHDLDHVSQVARVMARRCQEDVGPWREFLRVLQ